MKRMDITVSKQYEENKSTRLGRFQYFQLMASNCSLQVRYTSRRLKKRVTRLP